MIAYGGPPICGACRTILHEPRPDCPDPYVCTYEPGRCGHAGCRNFEPR